MEPTIETLGIIAGNRSLPLVVARQAKAAGIPRVVAVAFENETDPRLASCVEDIVWIRVGQLSRLIEAFTRWKVNYCVMAGQLAPKNLFDLRPDLRTVRLLLRVREKNAHTLFSAVADELAAEGITLIEATPWLKPVMPGPGQCWGRPLSPTQKADVQFGYRIAKEITRLEIGQTTVVKDGTVLAVEGFEGTDACLRRGGELAGPSGGAVAVKVARQNHDMRFDIPCAGLRTLQTCLDSGIPVLALEANTTLLLEREEIELWLKKNRFSLLTTTG